MHHLPSSQMTEKSVAAWNTAMELLLIAAFEKYSAMPKYVAAGGKNLRESGWQLVLNDMTEFGIDKSTRPANLNQSGVV